MTTEMSADVAVLMPKFTDTEMFQVRYSGLEQELRKLGLLACFVHSHDSYRPEENGFINPTDTQMTVLAEVTTAAIVRDLTMPEKPEEKQLYSSTGMRLVHHPDLNYFLRDKTNMYVAAPTFHPETVLISHTDLDQAFNFIQSNRVLIKPTIGMASEGVQVLDTPKGVSLLPGSYIAQEFIDTSGGMPELGIHGKHNLRVFSIGKKIIGGIARVNGADPDILKNDAYGTFVHSDDLPETTLEIVNRVHEVLDMLPGDGKNVIATDVMRGIDFKGEVREVLCEVNRRPMRISPWDLRDTANLSSFAIKEIGRRWDKAEAQMLASLVQ